MKKTYAYHKPSDSMVKTITKIRELFSLMDDQINECCPASRERSVALTKLEESCMWAVKSLVLNDSESVVEEGCSAALDVQSQPQS